MNRFLSLLSLLALTLSVVGCAGASPRPASGLAKVNDRGEKVICQMERPIGSNIAEMVCRSQESRDAQSQASRDAIRGAMKSGASPKAD